MIELEIQVLSERREGLIVDIGRSATAHKFALVRHRLVQADNGALLTLILRGPPRRQQALETALEHHPRITTFNVFEYDGGEMQPHFAAPPPPVVLPPQPPRNPDDAPAGNPFLPEPETPVAPEPPTPAPPAPAPPAEPELSLEEELQRFRLGTPAQSAARGPGSKPAPVPKPEPEPDAKATPQASETFVEASPLEADEKAIDEAMRDIADTWPEAMPRLIALGGHVASGARESTLQATGLRVGAMLRERETAPASGLALDDAITRIGVPALQPLVDVETAGAQLHLRHSPLCAEGASGCAFFSGLLEGLMGPAIGSGTLSIFPVCCRAYGADDCVLALSD
jgi:hypothetical protein